MNQSSGSALARLTLSRLRARISSGEWPIGCRIPTEPELSAELGVGRSTVREAIRSLATLGMVETLTARGTFVRSSTAAPSLLLDALSSYSPTELVGVRRALDVEAAQSAAANWTREHLEALESAAAAEMETVRDAADPSRAGVRCSLFHGVIAQASGNRLLFDLVQNLSMALDASGLNDRIAENMDAVALLSEHDRLLTAIRARDVGAAAHLMALHLDSQMRTLTQDPVMTELAALRPDSNPRPMPA
ncbi:FadR/GntR family transcriptional regulator [Microbacterium gorillae]|uniref:FadR/GntR family transcriptional regulator n=1 Tax=Microbacterium gorillae TaxID=1231063 RepID=UPI00069422AE|nr:FCD domain-containing protein [Microbacterium gorillae]